LKMELIECSETSAYNNQTPGKYPKEYIQDSKHGKSLKSRTQGAGLGMCRVFVTGVNGRCVQSAACFEQCEGTSLYHILPPEGIP